MFSLLSLKPTNAFSDDPGLGFYSYALITVMQLHGMCCTPNFQGGC